MKWVAFIVNDLCPSMGGFPTFCEDPDELLQLAEVREALESAGMSLHYWDGTQDSLGVWAHVPVSEKPLVIVEADFPRHFIESEIKNHLIESISVGEIFSKFHSNIVRELPKDFWDELFALHQSERPHRSPDETAILIGRAFYGVDPIYLTHGDGWKSLIMGLALSGRVLPSAVAQALLDTVNPPLFLTKEESFAILTDPVVARTRVKELLNENKDFAVGANVDAKSKLLMTGESTAAPYGTKNPVDWLGKWQSSCASPHSVLKFALEYGLGASNQEVSADDRLQLSRVFFEWLRQNYSYAMTSNSRDVLKLHTLVKSLNSEFGDSPLLLVVVDALGIESWYAIEEIWRQRIGFSETNVRGAFAILPTMTSLSRRAIFEGKIPSQFESGDHSQDLERKHWKSRFNDDGGYFTTADTVKIDHAFARQTKRVAIVDTSWDSMGHAIFPQADSVVSAAKRWGLASPLAEIIKSAMEHGYKVVITADHGQIACEGVGRPNVGSLAEQRSKRAMIFSNDSLLQSFAQYGLSGFQPFGMNHNMHVLFAQELQSFDIKGVKGVSHGGATIEEVIVPVIEVVR